MCIWVQRGEVGGFFSFGLSRLFLSFHFSKPLARRHFFGLRRMVARSLSLALLYILVSFDQYSVYTKILDNQTISLSHAWYRSLLLMFPLPSDSRTRLIDFAYAVMQGMGCCTTRRILVTAASHEQGPVEEHGRYGHLYGCGHVVDHVTSHHDSSKSWGSRQKRLSTSICHPDCFHQRLQHVARIDISRLHHVRTIVYWRLRMSCNFLEMLCRCYITSKDGLSAKGHKII